MSANQELVDFFASVDIEYDPNLKCVRVNGQRLDRLTEAYVVRPWEAGNQDINGAQLVYLRQPRSSDTPPDFGREPLTCLCSDAACRELRPPPKIIAAAYRKAQADGAFKQEPHWRWNPADWHHPNCWWVSREIAVRLERLTTERSKKLDIEEVGSDRLTSKPSPRRSDHVDVFIIRSDEATEKPRAFGANYSDLVRIDDVRDGVIKARRQIRREADHPSQTSILRRVVSSYERLSEEGRLKEARLTIDGRTRTFFEWFRPLSKQRRLIAVLKFIWYGGATVWRGDSVYILTTYDKVVVDGVEASVRLVLRFDLLESHRRGPFLREALDECVFGKARYVRVYWYGGFLLRDDRVIPDIDDDLDLIHLAPVLSA